MKIKKIAALRSLAIKSCSFEAITKLFSFPGKIETLLLPEPNTPSNEELRCT